MREKEGEGSVQPTLGAHVRVASKVVVTWLPVDRVLAHDGHCRLGLLTSPPDAFLVNELCNIAKAQSARLWPKTVLDDLWQAIKT